MAIPLTPPLSPKPSSPSNPSPSPPTTPSAFQLLLFLSDHPNISSSGGRSLYRGRFLVYRANEMVSANREMAVYCFDTLIAHYNSEEAPPPGFEDGQQWASLTRLGLSVSLRWLRFDQCSSRRDGFYRTVGGGYLFLFADPLCWGFLLFCCDESHLQDSWKWLCLIMLAFFLDCWFLLRCILLVYLVIMGAYFLCSVWMLLASVHSHLNGFDYLIRLHTGWKFLGPWF